MARARVDGIELEYETMGAAADRPLLLVQGLGGQLVSWDDRFCQRLVAHGFRVIRFDNRDAGLSTKLDHAPEPDFAAAYAGDRGSLAYGLEDMADDAAGLLDALGLPAAHVLGVSMGGMIAQTMATRHPARVRSLASIMSTTGAPGVGGATAEAIRVLVTPPPAEPEAYLEQAVAGARALAGPAFPFDPERVRRAALRAYRRCYHPRGTARQLAAVLAQADRTAALAAVTVPTVVIHGDADPLVDVSGGRATAAAVPGAELVVIPGLGHELPPEVWEPIAQAVAANADRAAVQAG